MNKPTFWQYITVDNPLTIPAAALILVLGILSFVFNEGYQASFYVGYGMCALEAFFWFMVRRTYKKL